MDGEFITANQILQKMLGYGEEELRGKTFLELTHADDINKNLELYEELKSGQRDHFQIEKRYRRKNGEYFWGRVTVSLVKDFQGKPIYTIGMVEDISQEKEAEEKLQESEEKLRTSPLNCSPPRRMNSSGSPRNCTTNWGRPCCS